MARENKTKETSESVDAFLDSIDNAQKREDCKKIAALMKKVTGEEPKMWGASIVGYGNYHYKSERSSQQGEWFYTGFSPRKANLTIYLISGPQQFPDLLQQLGKHKVSGGSCVYINKLSDIDINVLEKLIDGCVKKLKEKVAKN